MIARSKLPLTFQHQRYSSEDISISHSNPFDFLKLKEPLADTDGELLCILLAHWA